MDSQPPIEHTARDNSPSMTLEELMTLAVTEPKPEALACAGVGIKLMSDQEFIRRIGAF